MNSFQVSILGIAVALLVIILVVVGVFMSQNKVNYIYPPTALPCPDYWQLNGNGTCSIPVTGTPPPGVPSVPPVNIGTWDGITLDGTAKMPGIDANNSNIDFNSSAWAAVGASSATCAKKNWAKQNKILWDGVSNYNGC
jgi:hypothetical protein